MEARAALQPRRRQFPPIIALVRTDPVPGAFRATSAAEEALSGGRRSDARFRGAASRS